jgi:hypothetical protein
MTQKTDLCLLLLACSWYLSDQLKIESNELWKAIRVKAHRVRCRKAAIAYVTQDLVGFRGALIVNASRLAMSSGQTDAPLLRKLIKRGVWIYDCQSLHAKVILLGDVAI